MDDWKRGQGFEHLPEIPHGALAALEEVARMEDFKRQTLGANIFDQFTKLDTIGTTVATIRDQGLAVQDLFNPYREVEELNRKLVGDLYKLPQDTAADRLKAEIEKARAMVMPPTAAETYAQFQAEEVARSRRLMEQTLESIRIPAVDFEQLEKEREEQAMQQRVEFSANHWADMNRAYAERERREEEKVEIARRHLAVNEEAFAKSENDKLEARTEAAQLRAKRDADGRQIASLTRIALYLGAGAFFVAALTLWVTYFPVTP